MELCSAHDVEVFLSRELCPGTPREGVLEWVRAGHEAKLFRRFGAPGPTVLQLQFRSQASVECGDHPGYRRKPSAMASLFFDSAGAYLGHAVVDTSCYTPEGDPRLYMCDEEEIGSFMRETFAFRCTRHDAMRIAHQLSSRLPDLHITEHPNALELCWTGAATERGFMTAGGVETGLQSLSCSSTLSFDDAHELVEMTQQAYLQA